MEVLATTGHRKLCLFLQLLSFEYVCISRLKFSSKFTLRCAVFVYYPRMVEYVRKAYPMAWIISDHAGEQVFEVLREVALDMQLVVSPPELARVVLLDKSVE